VAGGVQGRLRKGTWKGRKERENSWNRKLLQQASRLVFEEFEEQGGEGKTFQVWGVVFGKA
jgi:hypothetical protein